MSTNETMLKDFRKGWITYQNLVHILKIAPEVCFDGLMVCGKDAEKNMREIYARTGSSEPFGRFILFCIRTGRLSFDV